MLPPPPAQLLPLPLLLLMPPGGAISGCPPHLVCNRPLLLVVAIHEAELQDPGGGVVAGQLHHPALHLCGHGWRGEESEKGGRYSTSQARARRTLCAPALPCPPFPSSPRPHTATNTTLDSILSTSCALSSPDVWCLRSSSQMGTASCACGSGQRAPNSVAIATLPKARGRMGTPDAQHALLRWAEGQPVQRTPLPMPMRGGLPESGQSSSAARSSSPAPSPSCHVCITV